MPGGHMPIAGSRPRIFSPRVPVQGSFLSRNPVLHRAPHALESQKIQQYAVSGFRSRSVSKGVATGSEIRLIGYLKFMSGFEELSSEGS